MLSKGSKLARKPLKRSGKGIQRTLTKKRTQKKIKAKPWKFKKTELSECDSAFSREIIARDVHCMFPGCEKTDNLTCSHYIGRANWNTRFDPENCVALCIRHHFMDRNTAWEFQKARADIHGWHGQYTLFMQEWLGCAAWYELLDRSEGKKTRKEAILETQKRYNLRQPVDKPEETTEPGIN